MIKLFPKISKMVSVTCDLFDIFVKHYNYLVFDGGGWGNSSPQTKKSISLLSIENTTTQESKINKND